MVKAITVECPCCHDVWELFLTSNAFLIILNCPKCYKTLLYHHHKCSLIDQHQIKQLQSADEESAIRNILKGIIKKEAARPGGAPVRSEYQTAVLEMEKMRMVESRITRDDVTNLRIQLELCKDVKTFIDSL